MTADPKRWWWLGAAVALGLVSTGPWTVPIASWLGAIVFLRAFRKFPTGSGLVVCAAAAAIVLAVTWRLFPFGGTVGWVVFAVVGGMIGSLPLLADRWLAPSSPGLLRTLPYPLATTALEFGLQAGGDLGSWGATAYSQLGWLGLAQLVAVTGLPGITFLVAWVGTTGNELLDGRSRRPALACAAVVALVATSGTLRLSSTEYPAEPVLTAAIAGPRVSLFPDEDVERRYFAGEPLSEADLDATRAFQAPRLDALWAETTRAIEAGARLVAWSEGAAVVLAPDHAELVARAEKLARDTGVVLVLPVATLRIDDDRRLTNEALLIDVDGVAFRYRKAIPTPGRERTITVPGDGVVHTYNTAIGRVAVVICYDLDFPALVAGAGSADLLVVPAGDWPAVARVHSEMARLRAVEQGLWILRPASAGLSTAVDPLGRVIASRWASLEDRPSVMFAHLPIAGHATPYGAVGDVFGWSTVIGLAAFTLGSAARRERRSGWGT